MRYLALGDSYTIGEQVALEDNFPNQFVFLSKELYHVELSSPEIIAQTGWTTHELLSSILLKEPEKNYDIVTLLIGVNNQYRGYPIEIYQKEFQQLLNMAISFAQNRAKSVFVLSIPDWGCTPFAESKNPALIKEEINAYNKINQEIALKAGCHYLDVTLSTRLNGANLEYLTPDLLHYNKNEYRIWAQNLANMVAAYVKKSK